MLNSVPDAKNTLIWHSDFRFSAPSAFAWGVRPPFQNSWILPCCQLLWPLVSSQQIEAPVGPITKHTSKHLTYGGLGPTCPSKEQPNEPTWLRTSNNRKQSLEPRTSLVGSHVKGFACPDHHRPTTTTAADADLKCQRTPYSPLPEHLSLADQNLSDSRHGSTRLS